MSESDEEKIEREYKKLSDISDSLRALWGLTEKMKSSEYINLGLQQAVNGLALKRKELSNDYGEIVLQRRYGKCADNRPVPQAVKNRDA